jgi:copper chaperone CopZ
VTVVSETIQVSGIRCERCVMRLAKTLEGADGLEYANANLMGQVMLSWDDERTSKETILEAMAKGGFRIREGNPGFAPETLPSSVVPSHHASGLSPGEARLRPRD